MGWGGVVVSSGFCFMKSKLLGSCTQPESSLHIQTETPALSDIELHRVVFRLQVLFGGEDYDKDDCDSDSTTVASIHEI